MILSNFQPKKSPFWQFLLEKYSKIHKIDGFGSKKSSENSKINIYSLVLQTNHPVALCAADFETSTKILHPYILLPPAI